MNIDYDKIEKQVAAPAASSMIETLRAIGYNLGTALADIIDNSISASAKNIWISRTWEGDQTTITIKDDGKGMTNEELIEAMRPGSQNPLADRSTTDLGRFGLGLKTASFSQCRRLSVISKKDGETHYWTWDLDYVGQSGKWELVHWIPEGFSDCLESFDSGTIVIWSLLDRAIPIGTRKDDVKSHQKFSELWKNVKQHIAMTFHRFMEEEGIKIFFEEHKLEPWNPFFPGEGTASKPDEYIYIGDKKIFVKGFVLPHQSKFSSEQAYKKAEGTLGYPALQGFYIYRGKRLLLAGNWLGLFRKEVHYNLVRIMIDLPNTMDAEWQIDIKKSSATLPFYCKEQLKSYASSVRNDGAEVYRHRGKILKRKAGTAFVPLWLDKKSGDRWSFVINRDHPMIKEVETMAKESPKKAINTLLSFVEETIPTKSIFIKESEEQEKQKEPLAEIDENVIMPIIKKIYNNKLEEGYTESEAKSYLLTMEPFNHFEEIINNLNL